MGRPLIAHPVDVPLGPERLGLELTLGSFVHDASHFPLDGKGIDVRLNEVLLNLGANLLEEIAKAPEDREVAKDRPPLLKSVVQAPVLSVVPPLSEPRGPRAKRTLQPRCQAKQRQLFRRTTVEPWFNPPERARCTPLQAT